MDNTISTPLYRQLENTIRQDIDTGKFPPGSQLPTENELSDIYHVSRVTVRKALSVLSDAGYLERHSGKAHLLLKRKCKEVSARCSVLLKCAKSFTHPPAPKH